mgnify:CR=1 FL=1
MKPKKKKKGIAFKPLVIKLLPTESEQAWARTKWVVKFKLRYADLYNTDELIHRAFSDGAKWMRERIVGNIL